MAGFLNCPEYDNKLLVVYIDPDKSLNCAPCVRVEGPTTRTLL